MKNPESIKVVVVKMLLFLPFLLSVFANPTIHSLFINNLLPVRIILPLLSIVSIYIFYNHKSYKKLAKDKLFWVTLFYIFVNLLTLLITLDLLGGLSIVLFFSSLLLFYIALYFINNILLKYKQWFFYSVITVSLITLFISWVKYFAYLFKTNILWWGFEGRYKINALIPDENHYSLLLVVITYLNIYLFLTGKRVLFILFTTFLIYSSTFMLLGTLSRSGLVSFFVSLIIYCTFYVVSIYKIEGNINRAYLTKLTFLIVFIITTIPFANKSFNFSFSEGRVNVADRTTKPLVKKVVDTRLPFYQTTPEEYEQAESIINNLPSILSSASTKSHVALIYSSFVLGYKKPLLGYGAGSFDEALNVTGLNILYAKYDPRAAHSGVFPAHTMYGHALAETGFIGLFLYLCILFILFKRYWFNFRYAKDYNNKVLALSFLSIFISYLVFSVFYNVHEEWFWVPAFIGLFIVKTKKNRK